MIAPVVVNARCVRCDRPELAEGLCIDHFAAMYGPLGLRDVPPAWALNDEETPMSAQSQPFECEGWYDSQDRHTPCNNPHPTLQGKGRCARCYSREYAANGKVRAPQITPRRLSLVEEQPEPVPVALPEDVDIAVLPPEPAPAPVAPVAEPVRVPTLRARHIRAVTRYAAICPNCDAELVAGNVAALVDTCGSELACGACGARWRVMGDTLADLPTGD